MLHSALTSAYDGVEGYALVVDDRCSNELQVQVTVECFGVIVGAVSSLKEVTALMSLCRRG